MRLGFQHVAGMGHEREQRVQLQLVEVRISRRYDYRSHVAVQKRDRVDVLGVARPLDPLLQLTLAGTHFPVGRKPAQGLREARGFGQPPGIPHAFAPPRGQLRDLQRHNRGQVGRHGLLQGRLP